MTQINEWHTGAANTPARWHATNLRASSRSDNRTYLLCVPTKRLRIQAEKKEQQKETRQDGDA